jgi:hypothetical protein
MANPFYVEPANPLAALMLGMQGYDRGQKYVKDRQLEDARNLAAQSLLSGGDSKSALAQLIRGGDVASANAIANFGNQTADQAYKTGMLAVAQQNANRQEIPSDVQKLKAAGIAPGTPEAAKALFPRTDTPISATDKKAIFEAEDSLPQIKGTIEALDRALELNRKTYTGYGAELFGNIGTKAAGAVGIQPSEQARATAEWSKLMGAESIQTMASTLKGATTDFELRKFVEMLADPSTDVSVRENIIKRMKTLAERQMNIADARIKDLRGGTYFKPGSNPGTAAPAGDPISLARDAIARGADRNAVIQRLQQNGINPSGL